MAKQVNIVRKIRLIIDSKDRAFIRQTYETLYRWQGICFRSANYLLSHQFMLDQAADLLYFTEAARYKLADVRKDLDGILVTSRANSTYRLLGHYFKGSIPMPIISCLNRTLVNAFFDDAEAYRQGERSLRSYKKNMAIPFNAENVRRLAHTADGRGYSFTLFSIPFRMHLRHGRDDKRALLNQVLRGEVKLCNSSLKLDREHIYMLAVFGLEKETHRLSDEIVAEATLSLDYPVIVKIAGATHTIGTREEFLHRRLAIQAARQRVQSAATYCRGRNGTKRKTKALEHYASTEKRYVDYKLHVYSRRLIDLCVKHRAATLILTDQQQKEADAKEDAFVFRNWSYGGLKRKVMYKADRAGITVIVE